MIQQQTLSNIETGGLGATQNFSVKQSPKMYAILMDKIYTDKPRAIIREICANALDAHKLNGNDKPFDVIMPSYTDPSLYIRDYGPGLSKAQVMTLYTTFFESTKDMSNDFVGALGLGSKSPFSYADMFTVVSRHGGRKMTFACFRDATGVPQISEVSDLPTNEEPGLQIEVPVRQSDFQLFREAAARTLKHFDAFKPGCFKLVGSSFQKVEYEIETPEWALVKNASQTVSYVRMGPIAYAVDWNVFQTTAVLTRGIELRLPIGSVDILPSREGLSLDDKSKQAIIAACKKVREEYKSTVVKGVEKETTPWERSARLKQMNDASVITVDHVMIGADKIEPFIDFQAIYTGMYDMSRKSTPSNITEKQFKSARDARMNCILLLNDMLDQSGTKQRLWSRMKELANSPDMSGMNGIYLIEDLQGLGEPKNLRRLSQIPLPTQVFSSSGKRAYPVIYSFRRSRDSYRSEAEFGQEKDGFRLPDESYYLPLVGTSCAVPNFKQLISLPSLQNEKIFGLTKRAQEDIDLEPHLNVIDYVTERVDELLKDEAVLKEVALSRASSNFRARIESWQHGALNAVRKRTAIEPEFDDLLTKVLLSQQLDHSSLSPRGQDLNYLINIGHVSEDVLPQTEDHTQAVIEFFQSRPFASEYIRSIYITDRNTPHIVTAISTGK